MSGYIGFDDGVVAIDLNTKEQAWAVLDSTGTLIASGSIYTPVLNSKSVDKTVAKLVNISLHTGLGIAAEKLAFRKSKVRDSFRSWFADDFATTLKSACKHHNIGLIFVYPKNTSVNGRKLLDSGLQVGSVHKAAAYCIGKKALAVYNKGLNSV